ncbi:MAG TPA: TraR/DksA C4-type zinc finger protein [Candidatus Binatia bacterium]|nr:TraR/DksA C4-type zinc finger protein [Candidatus Eisenbacteria bacterium]HEU4765082.1 TraR/DksA C4-type zinc finger protein [Candidatus Eisenbacteria bacterium]HYJ32137.1 TraR/DksA C4-type zinc finger protein [Candidatus Binatia bacterium]
MLNKKDLKHFEDRLLEERKKLLGQLGYLERTLNQTQRDSAGDLSAYSFHMADMGTDAMEREKTFLFASAEGRLLYNVDEALRRLYRNEYGICQSCGKEIGKARLDAIPQASLCVACQEKQEKETNTARG